MSLKKVTFNRVYGDNTVITDSVEVSRAVDMSDGIIYTYGKHGGMFLHASEGIVKIDTFDDLVIEDEATQ